MQMHSSVLCKNGKNHGLLFFAPLLLFPVCIILNLAPFRDVFSSLKEIRFTYGSTV